MSTHERGRAERKYAFLEEHRDTIRAWLEHRCLEDPAYPRSRVVSIYYDTPQLALYREKADGDLLKSKVRLRWYPEDGAGPDGRVRCFLETKRRDGVMGAKSRLEVLLPARRLRESPLADREIAELPERAGVQGALWAGPLLPAALIEYRRERFVDLDSGSRAALDTDIRCTALNDALLAGYAPQRLDTGVLEVKGEPGLEVRLIWPLGRLVSAVSFSKYARCLEQALEPERRRG